MNMIVNQVLNHTVDLSTTLSKSEATVSGLNTNVSGNHVVSDNSKSVKKLRLKRNHSEIKSVPAPRLVGVEPNPGPQNKSNKKKMEKVVIKEQPSHSQKIKIIKVKEKGKTKNKNSGGQSLGAKIGGYLGGAAQSVLGSIFGMGAYTVSSNSLMRNGSVCSPPPIFTDGMDGSIILSAREYISDVLGQALFTSISANINPANKSIFPRLAQLAPLFEQYEFLGLIFEYVTTSGTAVGSTNTALGSVIAATQYDVYNPTFASKVVMDSYKFATASVPSNSFIHPVECSPKDELSRLLYVGEQNQYTTLTGTLVSGDTYLNQDRRLYDKGIFQLSTVGQQASCTVGELWVSYHVRLVSPKYDITRSVAHIVSTANTGTASNPLTAAVLSSGSDLPVTFTNTTFTIPQTGAYMISAGFVGTGLTDGPTISLGSNIEFSLMFNSYTSGELTGINTGGTTGNGMYSVIVQANGSGTNNTITLGGLASMSAANADIVITRRNTVGGSPTTGF